MAGVVGSAMGGASSLAAGKAGGMGKWDDDDDDDDEEAAVAKALAARAARTAAADGGGGSDGVGVGGGETMWEYRAMDGAVHGPYPTSAISGWRAQGFFTGEQAVPMRPIGWDQAGAAAGAAAGQGGKAALPVAAVDELMADFDDDDEEDEGKGEKGGGADVGQLEASAGSGDGSGGGCGGDGGWVLSDHIDFSRFA